MDHSHHCPSDQKYYALKVQAAGMPALIELKGKMLEYFYFQDDLKQAIRLLSRMQYANSIHFPSFL